MIKLFYIVCLIILSSIPVHSLTQNLKFESLPDYSGLSSKLITCMVQDNQGYLWFGTQNGLNRYDGYKFKTFLNDPDDPNSISYNWINALLVDSEDKLWIGTFGGGINRFNPSTERFTQFLHNSNNPNSIADNYVMPHAILEDSTGTLWIGTSKGFTQIIRDRIKPDSDTICFINHTFDTTESVSVGNSSVRAIYENIDGSIWIGTNNGNLYTYNRQNKKINKLITIDDIQKIPDLVVSKPSGFGIIFIRQHSNDPQNILTIGTEWGIFKYDYLNKQYTKPYIKGAESLKKINKPILDYFIDKTGNIWIATFGEGIYILNTIQDTVYNYKRSRGLTNRVNINRIATIYQDRQGIIWIGLKGGIGIQKYNKFTQSFSEYKIEHDSNNYIINAIYLDSTKDENILWLGTSESGLLKYDRYLKKTEIHGSEILIGITSIVQSPENKNILWIGTIGHGLYKFNKTNNNLSRISYTDKKHEYLYRWSKSDYQNSNMITSLIFDKQNKLWIGTLNGLFHFNPETRESKIYLFNPQYPSSISANDVSALYLSRTPIEQLWIGTRFGGLNKLNIMTGTFSRFKKSSRDSLGLRCSYISSLYEDNAGCLWIGTVNGLFNYDKSKGCFRQVVDSDKKLYSEIKSIEEDHQGCLWLNSSNGLLKYNPKTNNLKIHKGSLSRWAHHQSESGELFYANNNILISFYPNRIKKNYHIPPLVLTDFQIFNKSITPEINGPWKKSISISKEINLSHNQSVFSFEFAALDYSAPQNNKYAYKMEGVDPDWVYTDASRRFATYTNLDPGEYTFRVKGSNNDGIWNEEGTSIKVIITPPWWETNLAYFFYLLLFISVVITTWRLQLRRIHMKHQLQIEHFEAEKLREVDHIKSSFFANISHEFRTPLTLIKGPVKQIMDGTFTGNLKEQCKMILRNSDRLLGLINQILELSKLESGEMKLNVAETDIVHYLKGLALTFTPLAETKKITLKFNASEDVPTGYVDRDKLEKIVTNLLSNAFKFTPEEGEVNFAVSHGPTPLSPPRRGMISSPSREGLGVGKGLQIRISNTGPGIPADQLDKIFDRFYQAGDLNTRDSEGTGIGLALTKELVEAHYGELHVESELNKSTTFTVWLPIEKEHFTPEEIADIPLSPPSKGENTSSPLEGDARRAEDVSADISPGKTVKKPQASKSAPIILIVEDNADVTTYITSFLDKDYRTITAENGQEAVKKVLENFPDLIISDVMMPEMDGFEFCRKIKSDERVSHIPVILLTAKADPDSKIEGLEFGADDYVTKPFEARELQIRAKNLIEQRRKLREKFSILVDLDPRDIAASSMDEQLMQRLLSVFEDHIEEPDFDLEQLSREIGMSRTHLNRKIHALTNLTTRDFIRTLRLKRAARLLKNTSGTVSEIAYRVGFNNLSYFSRAFRKHFGTLPSDFVKKQ